VQLQQYQLTLSRTKRLSSSTNKQKKIRKSKVKTKTEVALKKRYGWIIRVVSPGVGKESTVGRICERGGFKPAVKEWVSLWMTRVRWDSTQQDHVTGIIDSVSLQRVSWPITENRRLVERCLRATATDSTTQVLCHTSGTPRWLARYVIDWRWRRTSRTSDVTHRSPQRSSSRRPYVIAGSTADAIKHDMTR